MNISTYTCNSCCLATISDLGSGTDAHSSMVEFCTKELRPPNKFAPGQYVTLAPYYIYCAGPEVPWNHENGSHHSKPWTKYGTEFTAFIVENGLGEVTTLGQKFNKKYHPTTTAQVWLWSPNQAAMEAWWAKNYPNKPGAV